MLPPARIGPTHSTLGPINKCPNDQAVLPATMFGHSARGQSTRRWCATFTRMMEPSTAVMQLHSADIKECRSVFPHNRAPWSNTHAHQCQCMSASPPRVQRQDNLSREIWTSRRFRPHPLQRPVGRATAPRRRGVWVLGQRRVVLHSRVKGEHWTDNGPCQQYRQASHHPY